MLYVCKQRKDGKYGVHNTKTGGTEYYSAFKLIKMSKHSGLDVMGVIHEGGNTYTVTVLEPIDFRVLGSQAEIVEISDAGNIKSDTLEKIAHNLCGDNYDTNTALTKLEAEGYLVNINQYLVKSKHYLVDVVNTLGYDVFKIEDVDDSDINKLKLSYINNEISYCFIAKTKLIDSYVDVVGLDIVINSKWKLSLSRYDWDRLHLTIYLKAIKYFNETVGYINKYGFERIG